MYLVVPLLRGKFWKVSGSVSWVRGAGKSSRQHPDLSLGYPDSVLTVRLSGAGGVGWFYPPSDGRRGSLRAQAESPQEVGRQSGRGTGPGVRALGSRLNTLQTGWVAWAPSV